MIKHRENMFAAVLLALTCFGCTKAEFGGSNTNKAGANANGKVPDETLDGTDPTTSFDTKGVPEDFTDDINESGWINDNSFPDFETAFGGDVTDAGNGEDPNPNLETGIFTDEDGALQSGNGSAFSYWQPCDDESFVTEAETAFDGPNGSKVRVSGSFCPRGGVEITALFVIDFSGSMVDGKVLFNSYKGNDPTKGNSCGRLEATQAILKNLIDESPKGSTVNAGILGFSDDANMRKGIRDADSLLDEINVDNVCGSDGQNAWTNYEAAFDTATEELRNVDGIKVIYFISDGAPTRDTRGIDKNGERAKNSGLDAADRTKKKLDDLTMEIIFLGNIEGQSISEDYLEDLAGDEDNVTLVDRADDLGDAAGNIDLPTMGMDKKSFQATVTYPSGRKKSVALDKIKTSKNFGTTFLTQPFALESKTASGVHEVVITGETEENEELESQVDIKFRPSDL